MHDLLETALGLLQLLLQYCYSWGGRAPRSHTKGDLSSDCLPIASVFNWKIEVIYTWNVIAQCILFVSIGTSSSRKVVCIMYSLLMIIIRQAWPVHHMDGSNELFSFIFFWPISSLLTFYRMWRHQIIATCPCKHHFIARSCHKCVGDDVSPNSWKQIHPSDTCTLVITEEPHRPYSDDLLDFFFSPAVVLVSWRWDSRSVVCQCALSEKPL